MKIFDNHDIKKIPPEAQTALISVIVAVYNIEQYVERGVKSVLEQSYRNLEVILVDDGSTDRSGEICDRLAAEDERIVLIHKKNGGLADARNAGLKAAGGAYIGFVDGDDFIDCDMYEKMLSALMEMKADMAVCRYRQVHKDFTEDKSLDRVILFEGQEALEAYVEEREEYNIQNAAWNKLYRRETLENLSFETGRLYEDIMFTTRAISRAGRCVYLDTAYYNYIIDREGSIMNAHIYSRLFTDLIPCYREKTGFLKEIGRQELADVHDYFFYKRMLIFYNEMNKQLFPEKKEYLGMLTGIIKDTLGGRENYERIYSRGAAAPNERRKLALFLKSPGLYRFVMLINEKFILPVKLKIHKYRKIR